MQPRNTSDATLINRFALKERLLSRTGWYGFMIVRTWGIFVQAPIWAVVYLVYSLAAFTLVILPGLCAHCPYPSEYSSCLFLPPTLVNTVSTPTRALRCIRRLKLRFRSP